MELHLPRFYFLSVLLFWVWEEWTDHRSPSLSNEDNGIMCLTGLLWGLNEIMDVTAHTRQYLAAINIKNDNTKAMVKDNRNVLK